jgi:prepilin-type N-terminal cleavage/methylation domain-containing protein/prepilin-type processing-associated H-X9-DG protein
MKSRKTIQSPCPSMKNPNRKPHHHAFTLVEMLVTITIIVVLAVLGFSGARQMKLSAQKAESVNNLRSLSAATLTNAADNNGRFKDIHPANNNAPYWFSRKFRDDYQFTRSGCYSSANPWWKPTGKDIQLNRELWDWPDGVSSVWGYSCFVNDNGWPNKVSFVQPDNWNRIKDQVTVGNQIRWVPDGTGAEAAYPYLWMDIMRKYNGQMVGNFMKDGKLPLGVHIAYVDGHVEWVAGEKIKLRCNVNSSPLYW